MKKNILVLTTRFPYPVIGGDRLRIFNICKYLSCNHDITLLSFTEKNIDYNKLPSSFKSIFTSINFVKLSKIKSFLNCLFKIFNSKPLQVNYYSSEKFHILTNDLIHKNDIVICHLVRLGDYIINCNKPVVLEYTDSIALNYSRIKICFDRLFFQKLLYKYEFTKLLNYELYLSNYVDCKSFVSEIDRKYLLSHSSCFKKNTIVTPCGVDTKFYTYDSCRHSKEIVFIGNLFSIQNLDSVIWFIKHVLPLLDSSFTLKLVGQISKSNQQFLSKFERVSSTGSVDDVILHTKDALFGICTVQIAAGLQNKILEYMSMGIITITNSIGNEGINAINKEHIIVADSPSKMAKAITELSLDNNMADTIRKNARRFVENNFLWENTLKSLQKFLTNY